MDAAAPERRVLLFDGTTPPAEAAGYDVVPQVAGDLDERLAAMFDALDGPVLLVGMDTPQLTADLLRPVLDSWADGARGPDAWFGPANDGGFWALGLRDPDGALVRGVPMSPRRHRRRAAVAPHRRRARRRDAARGSPTWTPWTTRARRPTRPPPIASPPRSES
ncbi:DUF2064 domain-containing protein [Clavibacter tessellarius]|uniref:DUF2064 domain-containing protein n=1 Tax=Clavibacter tessellarius TaxID=31965 RepID=UPI00324FB679